MTITKKYKKHDIIGRFFVEKVLLRGFRVIATKETSGYSVGRGIIFGLLFLPLALFGFQTYIEVTYSNDPTI